MAAIREEQNRYPEATHWIKQFLERYPGYPEIDTIHVRLAWLQIDSGKYQEAVAPDGRGVISALARCRAFLCRSTRAGRLLIFAQRHLYNRNGGGL